MREGLRARLSEYNFSSTLRRQHTLIKCLSASMKPPIAARLPATRSKFEKGAIMTTHPTYRSIIVLVAAALLTLAISPAQADPPISVTPKSVMAGKSAVLTIKSNGFLDLSQVPPAQISINPGTGVSNIRFSNATPQSVTLSFDLASTAAAGERALVITADDVTISTRLVVQSAPPAACSPSNCHPPRRCEDGSCVRPACSRENCLPPRSCNDFGVCARPEVCSPACRPGQECKNQICVPAT
jgi:hypothetical protein